MWPLHFEEGIFDVHPILWFYHLVEVLGDLGLNYQGLTGLCFWGGTGWTKSIVTSLISLGDLIFPVATTRIAVGVALSISWVLKPILVYNPVLRPLQLSK